MGDRTHETSTSLATQPADQVFEPCVIRSAPRIEMCLNTDSLKDVCEVDLKEPVSGFGIFSAAEPGNGLSLLHIKLLLSYKLFDGLNLCRCYLSNGIVRSSYSGYCSFYLICF